MSFPEIQFPPAGAKPGPLASADHLDDPGFNCIDFAGYGGTNTRMSYVASPADKARLACLIDLRDGDVAGHWGGHRAEMWRHPHDLDDGVESWHAWSWWLGDGFQPPSAWMELGQLHSGDGGSPMQSLECLPNDNLNLSIRGDGNYGLGPAPRKTPIHALLYVKHSSSWGRVKFWLWRGTTPDPAMAPTVDRSCVTNIGGPSWTKVGLYSNGGACQAWLLGFGRAATAQRAMQLAGWGAVAPPLPPPPPPPPPADPCAQVKADLAAAVADRDKVARNLTETEAALEDATNKLELARKLLRDQITAWRSEKPARSWQWIQRQPAGRAYYGPLGGK